MTDKTEKTKEAFIVRDFRDAGTEKHFTGGAILPIEEGSFGNYKAAGLVRVPTKEDRAAVAKTEPAKPAA
jgi:hypothetical protein